MYFIFYSSWKQCVPIVSRQKKANDFFHSDNNIQASCAMMIPIFCVLFIWRCFCKVNMSWIWRHRINMCRTRDQYIFDENNFSSLRVDLKSKSQRASCSSAVLEIYSLKLFIIFEECKIRDGPLAKTKTNLVWTKRWIFGFTR